MSSPTSRALKDARQLGWTAAVVERWNQYARVRQDLFGFIDILCVHPELGVLGIQACADGSHAARRDKILAHENLPTVLRAGIKVEVWSYGLRGARGKRKLWELRREEIKA